MRYQLLALAAATLANAQSSTVTPAPAVTGNPASAVYVATLPKKEGSALAGSIHAESAADGTGVKFTVSISGLPAAGGPFMYHIHEKPVPTDGNCTGTGAHLDPYKRGEVPICDASKPETCQTGDLSGKFGNMTSESWSQEYLDLYSSTQPGTPAYFGDLSFVVHLSNKTRIGCANFTKVSEDHSSYPSSAPSSKPSYSGGHNTSYPHPTGAQPSSSPSPSSVPEFPGAAAHMGAAPALAVMVAFGAALML